MCIRDRLQAQLAEANRKAEVLRQAFDDDPDAQQMGTMPGSEAAGMQPMTEAAPQGDAAGPEQEADAKMQALAQMLGSMQAGQA